MYTALRATSVTLVEFLRQRFAADLNLGPLFDPVAGGPNIISLNSPQEMVDANAQGISVWLYRVVRDEERVNAPPERVTPGEVRPTPLPLRLHYLVTPIRTLGTAFGAESEQVFLGKVLQAFYDHPLIRGTDLQDDFTATAVELTVRLETLGLDQISLVWEALEGSYQLSVSYEVTVVYINSERELAAISPVEVALTDYGVIVGT
jgi:hypothetical protein